MSCKAAILVLFNFSSARKGEEAAAARDLRCQLVDILVNVAPTSESLQQQANRDSTAYPCPTVSGPPAHLLESTTPANSTVPGPPAHLLELTTPVNSTVPGPPAHLLELTTPDRGHLHCSKGIPYKKCTFQFYSFPSTKLKLNS